MVSGSAVSLGDFNVFKRVSHVLEDYELIINPQKDVTEIFLFLSKSFDVLD